LFPVFVEAMENTQKETAYRIAKVIIEESKSIYSDLNNQAWNALKKIDGERNAFPQLPPRPLQWNRFNEILDKQNELIDVCNSILGFCITFADDCWVDIPTHLSSLLQDVSPNNIEHLSSLDETTVRDHIRSFKRIK
jgi:hypothetical protein